MGFNVVPALYITTLEPMTEKQADKNNKKVEKLSKKFYQNLIKNKKHVLSLFEVIIFRISRSSIYKMLDENYRDYTYFKEQGWFKSDYYYPVKLNIIKKITGKFIDILSS